MVLRARESSAINRPVLYTKLTSVLTEQFFASWEEFEWSPSSRNFIATRNENTKLDLINESKI